MERGQEPGALLRGESESALSVFRYSEAAQCCVGRAVDEDGNGIEGNCHMALLKQELCSRGRLLGCD